MDIKLFNRDLTTPVLQQDLTDQIQRLRFGTKLNGGFTSCSFSLKTDLPQAWDWLTGKVFYRIVIYDDTKLVWEGRIQDIAVSTGLVEATAYGYYSSLNDQVYKTAYNANANVVIKAILTAAAPDISADQTNIAATGGPAITSAADASYLDQSARVLIDKLASFGDTSGDTWYFAVWEDRVPFFFKRDVTALDWLVRLEDLSRFRIKYRGGDLWNKVYAIYDAGGIARTADAQDTTSQTKYGVTRYYGIPDSGTVAAAAAQALRDVWLANHKDLWPQMDEFILGDRVFDSKGVAYPSYWVRAGDVIRVQDLVPASQDAGSVTLDALRTFFVMETNYDVDTATNSLVVDTENIGIISKLARSI